MTKILPVVIVAGLGLVLGGCVVASAAGSVVSTGVGVATTVVSTTADVASGAVHTVTGTGDKKPD